MSIKTVEIHERSGADGVIHLAIPTGEPSSSFRLVVRIEPDTQETSASQKAWPPGFLDEIVGGWTGEFVDEPEGPFEQRESF